MTLKRINRGPANGIPAPIRPLPQSPLSTVLLTFSGSGYLLALVDDIGNLRLARSFRADLATRGIAISFLTLASVFFADPFIAFLLSIQP